MGHVRDLLGSAGADVAGENELPLRPDVLASRGELAVREGPCPAFAKGIIAERVERAGLLERADALGPRLDVGTPLDERDLDARLLEDQRCEEAGGAGADNHGSPPRRDLRNRERRRRLGSAALDPVRSNPDANEPVDVALAAGVEALVLDHIRELRQRQRPADPLAEHLVAVVGGKLQ